jgi:hypothetical protein
MRTLRTDNKVNSAFIHLSGPLSALQEIDWSHNNVEVWKGRAMIGGQMSKVRQNVQLTANFFKTRLNLKLTPDEARLEENHKLVASRRYSSLKNSSIEL